MTHHVPLQSKDIRIAIAWLHCNEGGDGEREACKAAAEFFIETIVSRQVRHIAKAANTSIRKARQTDTIRAVEENLREELRKL